MKFNNLLITGGAGFAGSSLALLFKKHFADTNVMVLDNLMRRGSEINLKKLLEQGINFYHGDIRCREDLAEVPRFDLLIDCSAEPSVHAGVGGSPRKVIDINLNGTVNCLEAAREQGAAVVFLSTSRVYPIDAIRRLRFHEGETRLLLDEEQQVDGASVNGISEQFSLEGARSFYGSTKLASELLLQEYVYGCGMRAMINRCGVLTGPGQMGKVDQGVVALWVARHIYDKPLKYIGFNGTGKQVRDVLHINDLFDLLVLQLAKPELWDGRVYNVGGGQKVSVSLLELTELCREATGRTLDISPVPETSSVDIPVYISDCAKVQKAFNWSPQTPVSTIVEDMARWITDNKEELRSVF